MFKMFGLKVSKMVKSHLKTINEVVDRNIKIHVTVETIQKLVRSDRRLRTQDMANIGVTLSSI